MGFLGGLKEKASSAKQFVNSMMTDAYIARRMGTTNPVMLADTVMRNMAEREGIDYVGVDEIRESIFGARDGDGGEPIEVDALVEEVEETHGNEDSVNVE